MSKQPKFININGNIICRKNIKSIYINPHGDEIAVKYHEPHGSRVIKCESKQKANEVFKEIDRLLCSPQE